MRAFSCVYLFLFLSIFRFYLLQFVSVLYCRCIKFSLKYKIGEILLHNATYNYIIQQTAEHAAKSNEFKYQNNQNLPVLRR